MTDTTDHAPSTSDSNPADLWEYVRQLIDGFPPLTEYQRTHIAGLLRQPSYYHPPTRKTCDGNENDQAYGRAAAPPPEGDSGTQTDQRHV